MRLINSLNIKILGLLIFSLSIGYNEVSAQALRLGGINHQSNKHYSSRIIQQTDTISLPIWDDFSRHANEADTSIWAHSSQIHINNGLAYLAPSYNVATLDGFDASGTSYATDSRNVGIGDSLVSQAIDLSDYTNLDNISLSFFWQEGYGPTAPDSEDSLRLYFKNDSNRWIEVYAIGGSGSSEPIQFQQHFEQVNESQYLHAGFQFKFEYYGNLAGDFDSWNLDYIYLNEGNTSVSTANFNYDSYEDRTFSSIPQNLFDSYYGVPLKHITQDWLDRHISEGSLIYNNLWAGNGNSTIFGTEIFGTVRDTLNPTSLIDSIQVQGNFLTSAQDTALFNINYRNAQNVSDYLLTNKEAQDSIYIESRFNLGNTDSLFFETVNGTTIYYNQYSFRANDTIKQVTSFHDYYALDDGSAEASIQLNSKNYQMAQLFRINGGHYMTGIDMYIPNLAQNSGSKNITLLVLDSINGLNITDDILLAQNVLVNPSTDLNQFQRFVFEQPIFVEGVIYVGYREENDEVVSVGFDKNTNSATQLFYNQSGSWEPNTTLEGSVMIRPVFGDTDGVVANKPQTKNTSIRIWPNPNKGILYVSEDFDALNIYGLNGQLKYQMKAGFNGQAVQLPTMPDGLYIVEIILENKKYLTKMMFNQ